MIRTQSHRQLSLAEFDWPFQTALDENNRWIKMSQCIPWDALAEAYYERLCSIQGRPTKDARLVIGAVIIKHKLNLSDRETVAGSHATRSVFAADSDPIEGKFGQGKNGYRLNYIRAKRSDTSRAWINSIFLVMNRLILLEAFYWLWRKTWAGGEHGLPNLVKTCVEQWRARVEQWRHPALEYAPPASV